MIHSLNFLIALAPLADAVNLDLTMHLPEIFSQVMNPPAKWLMWADTESAKNVIDCTSGWCVEINVDSASESPALIERGLQAIKEAYRIALLEEDDEFDASPFPPACFQLDMLLDPQQKIDGNFSLCSVMGRKKKWVKTLQKNGILHEIFDLAQ